MTLVISDYIVMYYLMIKFTFCFGYKKIVNPSPNESILELLIFLIRINSIIDTSAIFSRLKTLNLCQGNYYTVAQRI